MIDVRPKLGTPHWREEEARHRKYFVVLFEEDNNNRLSRSWFADINIKKITSTSLLDSSVKDKRGPAAADRRVRQLLGKSAEERLALLSWNSDQAAASRKVVGSFSENDPTISGKRTGSLPASVVTKMAAAASPPFTQSTANECGVAITAGDSQGRPSLTAGRPDGSGRKTSGWAQPRSIYPEATEQKSSATKEVLKENAMVPRKERWTVTAESSQRLSCRRSSVTSLSTSSDTMDVSSERRGAKKCCSCIVR